MSRHGGADPGGNDGGIAMIDTDASAPYGFEEFERRDHRRRARRTVLQRGVAASFAVMGIALLRAVVNTPGGPPAPESAVAAAPSPAAVTPEFEEPALVDLSQLAQRSDLEDRIAWFDMQITEGRAYAAPADELASLAATRAQLERSLQQVSYAHMLMTL